MFNHYLLVACLACVGRGRRVQTSIEQLQSFQVEESQTPSRIVDAVHSLTTAAGVNQSSRQASARRTHHPTEVLATPLRSLDPVAAFNLPSLGARSLLGRTPSQESKPVALSRRTRLEHTVPAISMVEATDSETEAGRSEAEAKKAFENIRQKQGAEHPETLAALNDYASTISQDGRLDEAKPLMKEALQLTRQVLGPEHPETIRALKNYQTVFRALPLMSIFMKLGLTGFYRNFAVGSALVASVLWVLRSITNHLDNLAHAFGPAGMSLTPLAAALAGVCGGALHTLSGPDHLAALAPLALRAKGSRRTAFRTGAFWGSAHVLGQLLLGLGLLAVSRSKFITGACSKLGLAAMGEQLAALALGFVLIAIGTLGLKEVREWEEEGEDGHHNPTGLPGWRTFLTGVISGMQPDALLFCLPALALPSRLAGLTFLACFGAGTLVAMGAYAVALQAATSSLGKLAVKRVSVIASCVAITFGAIVCGSTIGIPLLHGLL